MVWCGATCVSDYFCSLSIYFLFLLRHIIPCPILRWCVPISQWLGPLMNSTTTHSSMVSTQDGDLLGAVLSTAAIMRTSLPHTCSITLNLSSPGKRIRSNRGPKISPKSWHRRKPLFPCQCLLVMPVAPHQLPSRSSFSRTCKGYPA